jgi:hypothetical protein
VWQYDRQALRAPNDHYGLKSARQEPQGLVDLALGWDIALDTVAEANYGPDRLVDVLLVCYYLELFKQGVITRA